MAEPDQQNPAGGAEPTLDELVARYLPRLHAYVRLHMGRHLKAQEGTADLVQSVCREVIEERGNFQFQGEPQFLGWLLTAAMNKVRERARFLGRQKRDPDRLQPLPSADSRVYASLLTPSREAIGSEQVDRLEAALLRLPDDYREVIVLSRIIGLPHEEIAARLGRTNSASRMLLGRALTRLAKELGEPLGDGR